MFVPNEFTLSRCLGRGSLASPQLAKFRTPSKTDGPSNFTQHLNGFPLSWKFSMFFFPINFASTWRSKAQWKSKFFFLYFQKFKFLNHTSIIIDIWNCCPFQKYYQERKLLNYKLYDILTGCPEEGACNYISVIIDYKNIQLFLSF